MLFSRFLATAAALGALAGCTGGFTAVSMSVRELFPKSQEAGASKLDPRFEYLRITRGKHVGLLWRGSVERNEAGPVDVYYSGTGEVLRMQNGRIVGASGLTTEWRRVDLKAPLWSAIASAPEQARVTRARDVMPGYISGLREDLVLRRVPAPQRSALRGLDPGSLAWFEERVAAPASAQQHRLPPAIYAIDLAKGDGIAVYAEQCLAADLCFTWQRWSAAMQQASVQ